MRDFDALYGAHAKTVYWAAYGVTKSAHLAEEAVQNVFLRAFRHMEQLSELSDAQCRAWLYRAAVNSGIDSLRRGKRLVMAEDAGVEERDTAPGPEEQAVNEEQRRMVRAVVEALPEKYREPVLLYYFAEMDYHGMSELLGLSEGTIKSRMSRARELLKKELMKGGGAA